MSTSLSEFLREKAATYKQESQESQGVIDEWHTAVESLFKQLQEWLVASDPDGIIRPEYSQIEVSEPGMGKYKMPRLNLRAFGKWIGVIPKARKTIKRAHPPQKGAPEQSTGRVDITDELRRYVLYRFPRDGDHEWLIDDPAANSGLQPLTRENFETALLSYFR